MANSNNSSTSNLGNTSGGDDIGSSMRSTVESLREKVSDAAERFTSGDMKGNAREVIDEAADMATEFYGRATSYLQENKLVGVVAIAAAVGIFGYFLGRNSSRSLTVSDELRSFE